jgi:glycerol-3-phosphate acyltransferase PlsY
MFTKYVSLGSVMGAGMFPILYASMYKALHFPGYPYELYHNPIILVSTLAMSVLIIYLHRQNFKRIMDGNENKLSFKKKVPEDNEEK